MGVVAPMDLVVKGVVGRVQDATLGVAATLGLSSEDVQILLPEENTPDPDAGVGSVPGRWVKVHDATPNARPRNFRDAEAADVVVPIFAGVAIEVVRETANAGRLFADAVRGSLLGPSIEIEGPDVRLLLTCVRADADPQNNARPTEAAPMYFVPARFLAVARPAG